MVYLELRSCVCHFWLKLIWLNSIWAKSFELFQEVKVYFSVYFIGKMQFIRFSCVLLVAACVQGQELTSIVDTAVADGRFKVLVKALNTTDINSGFLNTRAGHGHSIATIRRLTTPTSTNVYRRVQTMLWAIFDRTTMNMSLYRVFFRVEFDGAIRFCLAPSKFSPWRLDCGMSEVCQRAPLS